MTAAGCAVRRPVPSRRARDGEDVGQVFYQVVTTMKNISDKSIHAGQRGYTLLEMAIVMAVVGILIAAFANAYNIYIKNAVQRTTVDNTNQVVNAIGHFLVQNGRYPCPARLTAGRDDPDYGMEGVCDSSDLAYPAISVGECVNGICMEESDRTVNINPNPSAPVMVRPRVRRGAVPFRALSLPEDLAEDGYKQKLNYAVSENLAVANTYRKDGGAIDILDVNGVSAISPAASAHFVLFSSGEDGRGAYTRYGQLKRPCLNPAQALDAINCHTGSAMPDTRARYRVSSKATTDTSTHYDDHIKYYSSNETPLWRIANENGDITDLVDVGSGGRVAIGNNSPSRTLHVQGIVQVTENNNLEAFSLCNTSNNPSLDDCFMANLIGGDEPVMECPPGQVLSSISNGSVQCITPTGDVPCPEGEYMTGVNPDGTPKCTGVSGCPQITVQMCQIDGVYETAVIPPGLNGDTYDTIVSGISFRRHKRCNGSSWVDRNPATSGICSCTPVESSTNVSCHSSGVMPGSGTVGNAGATRCDLSGCWTGMATRPFTRTCPDGTETTGALDNSGCTCVPYTTSRTRNCAQLGHPEGWQYTGAAPRQESHWTCTGAQSGVWSGWTLVEGTDTCACAEKTNTRTLTCRQYYDSLGQEGRGYTGTGVPQTQYVTCPGPVTGPWTNDGPINCTCNSAYFISGEDSCTPPKVGSITWRRYMDCATGQLGPKEIVDELCSVPLYRWTQNGQQIPGGGALPHKLGVECTTVNATSTCSIPQGSDYAHYPCRCQ